MLVDRERGRILGVPDRGGVFRAFVDCKLGRGGRGLVGGGVRGEADPDESLGKGMDTLRIELVFDDVPALSRADDLFDMLVETGKYGG